MRAEHSGMRELIRHLKHGGPDALAAAKTLLETQPKLTPAELAEVKSLLPVLKDLFGAGLSEGLSNLLSGQELKLPTALETLMPNVEQVKPQQLPSRFGTDLQLVRPQLVNHPALSRPEKAERLFSFLMPFVLKLVKAPREQKEEAAPRLLDHARNAGFAQLQDVPTGRDGVQVAQQLLQAETPQQAREQREALQLDAPTWPETPAPQKPAEAPRESATADAPKPRAPDEARPKSAAAEPPAASPSARPENDDRPREASTFAATDAPQSTATPQGAPQLRGEAREAESARAAQARSRTDQRLGKSPLWNVLHLFRDDGKQDRESAAQRDEMNRLVVGMALAMGFLTLMAVILFVLR